MSPTDSKNDFVMLPRVTRDFILAVLRDTSSALRRTHGLRATTHILVEGGVRLTPANSFKMDHRNQVLLINLVQKMLARPDEPRGRQP